ncbi:MAG TPA: ornithine cyclodeaminase family protein [Candidatus Corynebacterium avicola]|uniref:Ornithine cyclodeaminase family protein n=1 Tax=Candidatus Corynebacterium avicola TaxID=2838527 RepID=A0A9D1RN66_9CORY|nr:ornithine cyclodeaminase family protein [Candidatus Corynebacterium avicola]
MSAPGLPRHIDAATVRSALSPTAAADAISTPFTNPAINFDPASDLPRRTAHTSHGHFLLGPSEVGTFAGVKVATVAPGNPALGRPRIDATYLLYDAESLQLESIIDGVALTNLRTPAVSIAALRPTLALVDTPVKLVVFGAGPQGVAHIEALAAELGPRADGSPFDSVDIVVRNPDNASDEAQAAVEGVGRILPTDSQDTLDALADADIIVTATSADTPLFQAHHVRDDVLVIAVGSHEPNTRELDADFIAGAKVIVEDIDTALETAGDIVLAHYEGAINPGDLVSMRSALTEKTVAPGRRPVVFKSVGMSWQDLLIAEAVDRLSR